MEQFLFFLSIFTKLRCTVPRGTFIFLIVLFFIPVFCSTWNNFLWFLSSFYIYLSLFILWFYIHYISFLPLKGKCLRAFIIKFCAFLFCFLLCFFLNNTLNRNFVSRYKLIFQYYCLCLKSFNTNTPFLLLYADKNPAHTLTKISFLAILRAIVH